MIWILLFMLLQQQEDSPLVKAAKAAGGPRKPSGKVITNDVVKKAANKSGTATAAAPKPTAAPADTKTPSQKQDDLHHARIVAANRADIAEKKVAELEAELRRVELAYYEESDLNRRDTVLVQRFEQTRKQLEEARRELADARDALTKLQ